jgi:penicillin-binding protein A
MTKQIQRLGLALMALFVALFAQLNYVQVVRADKLNNDPRNTRAATRDFARSRGFIQTADGVVLARSVPSDGVFKRQRQYPEKDLFAHITGYFSFTFGTTGVEQTYNDELAGRDIDVRLRRPGDLRKLLEGGDDATGNVTLTVTKQAQQAARDALGARRGSVVALDPKTGAVLALWSFPSYDPEPLAAHSQEAVRATWTQLQSDPNRPLLPRSYRETFAPGSTFKVVTAAAALDRQPELATKNYPVLARLELPQSNRSLPNFGGGRCGGPLPQLLKVSCNTGFAQMGLDLGAENLTAEATAFGFNERPPFDLRAVPSGFPDAGAFERNLPALAQSAIGQQDVRATPLQMAVVAAAIGNGGVAMKPHVMRDITNNESDVVGEYDDGEWRRMTSPQTAAAVREMMVGVVNGGTATRVAIPGVQVAAKTGTAQTTGDNAHAWIIALPRPPTPRSPSPSSSSRSQV